jgi:hypothetical protein
MKWTGVTPEYYGFIQEPVRQFMDEALNHQGFYDIDYAYYEDRIVKCEMQLWVLYKGDKVTGMLITHLGYLHGQLICDIPLLGGGDAESWEKFHDNVLLKWCEENKVDRIDIRSRKGIAKILARHGYCASEAISSKRLTTTKGH